MREASCNRSNVGRCSRHRPPIGATAPATAAEAIVFTEYWAAKQRDGAGIRLAMYRKRIDEAARPVLFMVHGSSNSARSSFDLTVPGRAEYSMMDAFARYGFDVWTMDLEGYGKSSRPTETPTSPAASRI